MSLLNRQDGDTLVEVSLAMVVLTLVIIGSFQLGLRAMRLGLFARQRTQAANLLQQQAEALRILRDSKSWTGFQNALSGGAGCVDGSPFYLQQSGSTWVYQPGQGTSTVDGTPFTIQTIPTGCGTDEITFSLSASWSGLGGPANSTSLKSILVKEDVF